MLLLAAVFVSALAGSGPAAADVSQGFLEYYAYDGEDAVRSFDRALALDPRNANAAWGKVLALGPDLNTPMTQDGFDRAAAAVPAMQGLRPSAAAERQQYIDAMALRYHGTWHDFSKDDERYRNAMIALAAAYPLDDDAQLIAAEALLENNDSRAAAPYIERVLARNPDHPMADHLCIHVYDSAETASHGIACAQRLDVFAAGPAEEHLAHMPAHTWILTGDYRKAVASSVRAVTLLDELMSDGRTHVAHAYDKHDSYIGYSAAMMLGDYASAQWWSARISHVYQRPYAALTALRFGQPIDPGTLVSLDLTQRAMVLAWDAARRGDRTGAEHAAHMLTGGAGESAYAQLALARVSELRGNRRDALYAYDRAQKMQHADFSGELIPLFPAETERAAYLLRSGDIAGARIAFAAAVDRYHDPRAMFGYSVALKAAGSSDAAQQMQKLFTAAWNASDPPPTLNDL